MDTAKLKKFHRLKKHFNISEHTKNIEPRQLVNFSLLIE